MPDIFSETTQIGWFSRIGKSIKGVLVGMLLVAVSVIVLFWGEGRAVYRAQALAEGKSNVVSVDAAEVNPANEGKLIHLSANASSKDGIEDADFGVEAPGVIRLARKVEMYQWKQHEKSETRKQLGGGEETTTTYSYDKVWDAGLIDSANFKQSGHPNPTKLPAQSETWNAPDAKLGAFELNAVVLDQLTTGQPLAAPEAALENIKNEALSDKHHSISQGMIYFGNASSPAVGDVRVSYSQWPSGPLSVVARQTKSTFEPYPAKTGEVLLAQVGTFSAEAMFKQAEEENAMITWIIRGVGFVVIWIGIGMILSPLATIADVVPFIGSIIGTGTFIAAFVCAMPIWMTTVAIAWIFYRPLIGIALLVVGIGVPVMVMRMRKSAPKAAAA